MNVCCIFGIQIIEDKKRRLDTISACMTFMNNYSDEFLLWKYTVKVSHEKQIGNVI